MTLLLGATEPKRITLSADRMSLVARKRQGKQAHEGAGR